MAPVFSCPVDLRAQIKDNCLFLQNHLDADFLIIVAREAPKQYKASVVKTEGRTRTKLFSASGASQDDALQALFDETCEAVNDHIKTNGYGVARDARKHKSKKSHKVYNDDSDSDITSSATTVDGYETFSDEETVSVTSVANTEGHGRRSKHRGRSTKKSTTRKSRRPRSRSPSSSSSSSDFETDVSSISRPRVSVVPPFRAITQRPTAHTPYATRSPLGSQPAPQIGVAVPPPLSPGSQQPHTQPLGPHPQRIMPQSAHMRFHDVCLVIKHHNGSTETERRTISQVAELSQKAIEQGALAYLWRQSLPAQPGNSNNAAHPTTGTATKDVNNADNMPPPHRRIQPSVIVKVKSVSIDGNPYDLSTYRTNDLTKIVEMLRAEAKDNSAIPRFEVDIWNKPYQINTPAPPGQRMPWGYGAVHPPAVGVPPSSLVPPPPPPPPPPQAPVLASPSSVPPPVPRGFPVISAQASTNGVVPEGSALGPDTKMG
ncbi:uncharacterized protein CTHT_0022600 [Thermochaetoides thermophila DSM 1495]|uniref:Uncharacterized protein n=1 Tax=Chaetomium thermophilum (strain DSM 1495 / CBS 144.50 / IMI 039719) TaxID=759272 RepID=G0S4F2_CHATD|nr:hypothetical protein CTHT_0022600 [Thermochaetoides thermophila DSM 1495]EGS20430.1 hypothetical protein CTHT_0022600 [Thermochaetoides thermophila DSM 1495]